MATRVRLGTDKGSDDMARLSHRPASRDRSLASAFVRAAAGSAPTRLAFLASKARVHSPCCPCRPEVLITPGVPGRALVSGKELFSLLHGGDFAGQTGAGPDRRGLTHNGDLGLSDDTVPVVHDVQASVDPAKGSANTSRRDR
jgi:hypothetical protein